MKHNYIQLAENIAKMVLKISFLAISMLVRENGSNKERSLDKCWFFATKIPDPYSED